MGFNDLNQYAFDFSPPFDIGFSYHPLSNFKYQEGLALGRIGQKCQRVNGKARTRSLPTYPKGQLMYQ